MSKRTDLEDRLAKQLEELGIQYEREFMAVPGRRFRWDFLVNGGNLPLLVEVQGGIWGKGGHTSGPGVTRDCEKLSLATLNGFAQMNFTGDHVKSGFAAECVGKYLLITKLNKLVPPWAKDCEVKDGGAGNPTAGGHQ